MKVNPIKFYILSTHQVVSDPVVKPEDGMEAHNFFKFFEMNNQRNSLLENFKREINLSCTECAESAELSIVHHKDPSPEHVETSNTSLSQISVLEDSMNSRSSLFDSDMIFRLASLLQSSESNALSTDISSNIFEILSSEMYDVTNYDDRSMLEYSGHISQTKLFLDLSNADMKLPFPPSYKLTLENSPNELSSEKNVQDAQETFLIEMDVDAKTEWVNKYFPNPENILRKTNMTSSPIFNDAVAKKPHEVQSAREGDSLQNLAIPRHVSYLKLHKNVDLDVSNKLSGISNLNKSLNEGNEDPRFHLIKSKNPENVGHYSFHSHGPLQGKYSENFMSTPIQLSESIDVSTNIKQLQVTFPATVVLSLQPINEVIQKLGINIHVTSDYADLVASMGQKSEPFVDKVRIEVFVSTTDSDTGIRFLTENKKILELMAVYECELRDQLMGLGLRNVDLSFRHESISKSFANVDGEPDVVEKSLPSLEEEVQQIIYENPINFYGLDIRI